MADQLTKEARKIGYANERKMDLYSIPYININSCWINNFTINTKTSIFFSDDVDQWPTSCPQENKGFSATVLFLKVEKQAANWEKIQQHISNIKRATRIFKNSYKSVRTQQLTEQIGTRHRHLTEKCIYVVNIHMRGEQMKL